MPDILHNVLTGNRRVVQNRVGVYSGHRIIFLPVAPEETAPFPSHGRLSRVGRAHGGEVSPGEEGKAGVGGPGRSCRRPRDGWFGVSVQGGEDPGAGQRGPLSGPASLSPGLFQWLSASLLLRSVFCLRVLSDFPDFQEKDSDWPRGCMRLGAGSRRACTTVCACV